MLELANQDWAVALLPEQGGAMARLAWRGIELLQPLPLGADPNASFCGAFLMLPWANRLDAGRLPFAGTDYQLPVNRAVDNTAIHGIARDLPWVVESASPTSIVLRQLMADAALPWRYAAQLTVTIGADVAIALSVENLAEQPFPFGCGWHPFFLRPAGTRLQFAAAALLTRDGRGLPLGAEDSAGIDGDEAAYEGLDTHFAGWNGTARIIRPDASLLLRADGAWAGNLQVFAPVGSGILCVEPVSHVPDAPNCPALAALGALRVLAPGAVMQAGITLHAMR